MLHLNKLFSQLAEKYGIEQAILMFEETVEVAKLITKPTKRSR
jgi:hypothetical protein